MVPRHGYALRANHADAADITATVKKLQDLAIRTELSEKCGDLSDTSGGAEIAQLLLDLAAQGKKSTWRTQVIRFLATQAIHKTTYLYRLVRPQSKSAAVDNQDALFSSEIDAEFLRTHIRGNQRFEHMIAGASKVYVDRRHEIARDAYGK